MLRSEDMRLTTIFSLEDKRSEVFSALQRSEIIQLKEIHDEETSKLLKKRPPTERLKKTSDLLIRVSRLINVCKIAKVKLPFPQEMFGLDILNKRKVNKVDEADVLEHTNSYLSKTESQLLKLEDKYNTSLENLEEQKALSDTISSLKKNGLEPTLLLDTKHLSISAGVIPTAGIEKLESDVSKESDGFGFVLSEEKEQKESTVVIVTLIEHASKINFLLKKHSVAAYTIPPLPKVKDLQKWIATKIKTTENTISESLKDIEKARKKHFEELVVIREQLEIIKHRVESMHKVLSGNAFFVLQGWVPKSKVIEISKTLFEATDGHIILDFEPAKAEDEPPVKMTNPGWLKPFEVLTELYAAPKYKDLDPTFIVGPIFLIFAGFMLTDFFYGLGLVILGLVMIFYFAKYAPGIKAMAISITGIGIFSMIFGVLTGSYLGDAMLYFFGKTSAQLAIWKDPLADPLYFLIISLSVAIVHLNIGLLLGLFEDIRKKDYQTMLKDRIVWWLIQITILLWYLGVSKIIWVTLGVITLIIVIATSGPLGLLGITGFMGDAISYSRLFALALSTAGIAMTVNLLANLLAGVPYVGFLLAAIIFIAGHIFSFAMNALGAFVHSIRLQFVEFFGKFYEGGGDKFEPFKEERYYTEYAEAEK